MDKTKFKICFRAIVIAILALVVSFPGNVSAKDPGSLQVIKSGIELFSLVEANLGKQGLIIRSIEDATTRKGCEEAFTLHVDGVEKKICAGSRVPNYIKVVVHNLDERVWETVSLGPGEMPGVKGVQGIVCTKGFREAMYEHGIEVFEISTRMAGEQKDIASCMTQNRDEVLKEIFNAN